MNRKLVLFGLVLGLFAVLVASCQNDSEENRAVVIVSSINGNLPYFSDLIEQGDTLYLGGFPYVPDDFITEDYVVVTFYNRPYNRLTVTGTGQPLSDFLITRYRIEWSRTDGGDESILPPVYEGAASIQVPSNTMVEAAVLLIPFQFKYTDAMQALNYLNPFIGPPPGGPYEDEFPDEVLAIAHFTFWGHEVGTKREWSIPASLTVNIGDAVQESED